jgi:uncharacterized protein (DUF1697 family)
MPVFVSLLRGVNLGPHNSVRMADLKPVYESLGLGGIETYVQSGNVAFRAAERKAELLEERIAEAIGLRFGFRPAVILRTAAELRAVIGRRPFAERAGGIDPSKLLVHFLAREPDAATRAKILEIQAAPEEVWMAGRELYIYFPNGMARPKLSMPRVEKTLAIAGTGRNWNTVLRLLEIAERLEASAD